MYYFFKVCGYGDNEQEAWNNCYENLDESVPEVLEIEEEEHESIY